MAWKFEITARVIAAVLGITAVLCGVRPRAGGPDGGFAWVVGTSMAPACGRSLEVGGQGRVHVDEVPADQLDEPGGVGSRLRGEEWPELCGQQPGGPLARSTGLEEAGREHLSDGTEVRASRVEEAGIELWQPHRPGPPSPRWRPASTARGGVR